MTLAEMRTVVQNATGNQKTTFLDIIDVCLKSAQKTLATLIDFPELRQKVTFTTTASDNSYTFTDLGVTNMRGDQFYSIHYLKTSDAVPVTYVDPIEWDSKILPSRTLEGEPSHYTIWGRVLDLYKIPDDAYNLQIRYFSWPTFPAAAGDDMGLQDVDELIQALAISYAFGSQEKQTQQKEWRSIFSSLLNSFIKDDIKHLNNRMTGTKSRVLTTLRSDYYADPFVRGVR